ncbi:MAG: hypothetical protein GOV15_00900 [Candidatus Diapherotrites archaeon]|nr:hypothetical protein [Candidatus Diapherotrites archaeon]
MDLSFKLGEKGQATIMDAILFLLVTSALATSLFYFTVSYGSEQEVQLTDRYLRSYASSTYKALLWSPVVREGGFADYLLAFSKEKGSDDHTVKQKFAENLYRLNLPINASRDYMFSVYDGSSGIGTPAIIVFKEGNRLFYCLDADDSSLGGSFYDTGVNLTTFVDSANDLTSTEGLVTFNNRVFKTVLVTWPMGINTTWDINNDSDKGDQLCGVTGELVEPPGDNEVDPEYPVRVVEVDTTDL